MVYIYDKSGQDIYFQRESDVYGHIYDPEDSGITVWTKIPANYPHWRKLDYITDSFDPILPIIEKIKIFDIGDSKHASAVVNGNIEPVDFTIDMEAQGLEFLMLAIGAPAYSSAGRAHVQTITCPAEGGGSGAISQGDYFLIDAVTSDVVEHFAVWMDTAGDGSTGKPTITGIHADNVLAAALNTNTPNSTAAQVATAVGAIIANDGAFGTSVATAVVTVTGATAGSVQPARDSGVAPTLCTFATTTWGSTTYTVTEALTTDLPHFTIHLEQRNTTAAENIVWDLFGCVVESVVVNVAFGDKIVKYSVTIQCPYAVEGNTATNPPTKKLIPTMSAMSALQESASNYIVQEGTTDRTPSTVEKVVLTITNNVKFQSDISKQHMIKAVSTVRDVKLNIIGATHEKELFNYWQAAFTESDGDYYPTGADRLNTVFKLQREATYDYVSIAIYNWMISEHNFSFVSAEDAVKMVDITLEDGSADSTGRILTATTFVSFVDSTIMVEDALA